MGRKVFRVAVAALGLLGLAIWNLGTSLAEEGAKDIFEGELKRVQKTSPQEHLQIPKKPDKPEGKNRSHKKKKQKAPMAQVAKGPANKGVMYWIELLTPDEAREQIAGGEERVFRTGERIRFHFRMNSDGYLYIWQKGAKGDTMMLFPDPRVKGGENYVQREVEYVVPEGMWFKFDEPPGTLEYMVMLSRKKVSVAPELAPQEREVAPQGKREAQVTQKGRRETEKPLPASMTLAMVEEQTGSKDLRLETVSAGVNPASYIVTVSQEPEWMVAFRILLKQK